MEELVYVYYGKDDYLLTNELNKKIESLKVDSININKYDLLENSSEEVLEDLRTVSFFTEKKIIVIKNLNFVTQQSQEVVQDFINYIEKPNEDVYLFIVLSELIDKKSLLGKALFNKAYLKEVKQLTAKELPKYITNILESASYKITNIAIEELISRTGGNLSLIKQELDKLMLFCLDDKAIKKDHIEKLVSRNLEDNIYELTNNLISHKNKKVIENYYDLMSKNEEPLRILSNIVAKIKELMHTKLLLEQGLNDTDIISHFHISKGRAYYLVKNARSVPYKTLEDHIEKLAMLDYEIKSGKVDKKLGLELFLLGV